MMKTEMSPTGKLMPLKAHTGFTLLELLVVLAIIALGSAIILPGIANTEGKLFRAQIRELAGVLKYNRRNAVITGQTQLAQLHPYNDAESSNKKKGQWYSRGAHVEWHNKEKNNPAQTLITIQFFPQGGATGGTLLFKQGEFQSQLIIDSFTGKLTIKEVL